MTAATKDRDAVAYSEGLVAYPVAAATTIYLGTAVAVNSSGYAVALTDSAAVKFVGIASEGVINTTAEGVGAAGDLNVKVHTRGVYKMVASGLALGDQMCDLYWTDNQTVGKTVTDQYAGKLVRYTAATEALVDIAPALTNAANPEAAGDDFDAQVAGSTTIVVGTMVCFNASGYLVPAANTAGFKFAGIALEGVVNAGSDGEATCRVRQSGVVNLTAAGLTVADQHKPVWVSNATTVTTTPGYVRAGVLRRYSSATVAPVDIAAGVNFAPRYFHLNMGVTGALGATTNLLQNWESPVAVCHRRTYASMTVAPGSGKSCVITSTDGTTANTLTIADTAVAAEDEAVNDYYAANTDMDFSVAEDGSGEGLQVTFVFEEL